VAGPTAAAAALHDPALHRRATPAAPLTDHHVGGARPVTVADAEPASPGDSSATDDPPVPAYEATTGGLQAPDEPAEEPAADGTTAAGTSANGPTPATAPSGPSAGTETPAPGTGSAAAPGTGATSAPTGPTGQVSGTSAPVAQGASAPPAG
jgi:hypothetical protein